MKKILRVFSAFFAVLLFVIAIPFSAFAVDVVENPMDSTSVRTDLANIGFDPAKYGKDTGADFVTVIDFLEFGYDANGNMSMYGLYLYLYNPSGKEIKAKQAALQLAYVDKNGVQTPYNKYSLSLISVSTEPGQENVLYKFKVDASALIAATIHEGTRKYFISGVETLYDDALGAKPVDTIVGLKYFYTGYQKNFTKKPNDPVTLYKTFDKIEVASVEMHPASWFSKTADFDENGRYEILSVYFNVPTYFIKTYGNPYGENSGLVQVKGQYNKKVTNGLLYSGENLSEDELISYLNKDISSMQGYQNSSLGYGLSFYSDPNVSDNIVPRTEYELTYNHVLGNFVTSKNVISKFGNYVKYSNKDYPYTSQSDFLAAYNAQGRNSWIDTTYLSKVGKSVFKGMSSEPIPYLIDNANGNLNSSIKSFADGAGSSYGWLRKLFNKELFSDSDGYPEIMPLVEIDSDSLLGFDETVSDNLFIMVDDVDPLTEFYNEYSDNNHIYLMRLEVNPYYATDVTISDGVGGAEDGVYFEKIVLEDIDMFELVFQDEGGNRVSVPVSASPIDNVGAVVPGPGSGLIDKNNPNDDNGKDPRDTLKGILGIIIALLIIAVVLLVVWGLSNVFGGISRGIAKTGTELSIWRGKQLENRERRYKVQAERDKAREKSKKQKEARDTAKKAKKDKKTPDSKVKNSDKKKKKYSAPHAERKASYELTEQESKALYRARKEFEEAQKAQEDRDVEDWFEARLKNLYGDDYN